MEKLISKILFFFVYDEKNSKLTMFCAYYFLFKSIKIKDLRIIEFAQWLSNVNDCYILYFIIYCI